jgi:hypothetical protein
MYAYFGHHRCATLWTAAIVRALSRELGVHVAQEDRYEKLPDGLGPNDFLIHLNATQGIAALLAGRPYRGFHVIRDPRDILVSSYFSDRYSHPVYRKEFEQFRDQLNNVEFDEGLRLELDRRAAEFEALACWDYHNPDVLETRYEVLTVTPADEFARILTFLGIPSYAVGSTPLGDRAKLAINRGLHRLNVGGLQVRGIPREFLDRVIARQAFQKLAGRSKGQEDQKSHYRKGVAGDWINYLQGANKELFKQRWGQLLIDLGYEKDLDW